jgi:hypothetical protein
MFPVGNKSVFEDVAIQINFGTFCIRKLKKRQKGSIYEVD